MHTLTMYITLYHPFWLTRMSEATSFSQVRSVEAFVQAGADKEYDMVMEYLQPAYDEVNPGACAC